VAVDGDRLGDGDGAEAAGIEAVDLAVERGLGDGAGEGLARPVRLQGLASSPTPETQVREAWACAGAAASRRSEVAAIVSDNEVLRMMPSEVDVLGNQFMTVILRWLSAARPSKDARPGPSPFEGRTQPSLRRLRTLACGARTAGWRRKKDMGSGRRRY
jgi:hypothetical protein